MKMSFRVDVETDEPRAGQAIITELSRLRTGLGIQIIGVHEINPAEHSDKYQSLVDTTAKKIFIKMLENGADNIYEVENLWLNEYADMLYTLFPEGKRCVQDLYQALNTLKERGVIVSVNTNPAKSIVPDSVFTIKD